MTANRRWKVLWITLWVLGLSVPIDAAGDDVAELTSSLRERVLDADQPHYLDGSAETEIRIRLQGLRAHADRDVLMRTRLIRVGDAVPVWTEDPVVRLSPDGAGEVTATRCPADLPPGVYAWQVDVMRQVSRGWNRFLSDEPLVPRHERAIVILPEQAPQAGRSTGPTAATPDWQVVDAQRGSGDRLESLNRWMSKSRADLIPGLRQISGIQLSPLLNLPRGEHAGRSVAALPPGVAVSLNLITAAGRLDPRTLLSGRTQDEHRIHRLVVRYGATDEVHLDIKLGHESSPESEADFTIDQKRLTTVTPIATTAISSVADDAITLPPNGAASDPATDPPNQAGVDQPSNERWDETAFFVLPRNHQVRLTLTNAGNESVFLDAVRLESIAKDESPDSATDLQQNPQSRDVLFRLGDPAWAAALTRDIDVDAMNDTFTTNTLEVHRRHRAIDRLADLLRLQQAAGVVLPEDMPPSDQTAIRQTLPRYGMIIAGEFSESPPANRQEMRGTTDQGVAAPSPPSTRFVETPRGVLAVTALRRGRHAIVDRNGLPPLCQVNPRSSGPGTAKLGQAVLVGCRYHAVTGDADQRRGGAWNRDSWWDLQSLIARRDADTVILDFPVSAFPIDARLAATLSDFRRLPRSPGRRIPCDNEQDQSVTVLRYASSSSGDDPLLSLGNLTPWKTRVTFRDKGFVDLEPGQWKLIGSTQSAEALTGWSAAPAGGSDLHRAIRWKVTRIVERMGFLDQVTTASERNESPAGDPVPRLTNGGFEIDGRVGLSGWVHSQFPEDAVVADSKHATQGDRSIRMTNAPGAVNRVWIISESIAPPASGRLAVSAALRGERRDDSRPLVLRLTLEGNLGDRAFRRSRTVRPASTGSWHPRQTLLEVDGIDPATTQLRLAIDTLATGPVWIDDVQLATRFPLERERQELQRQTYLAVEGIRQENLTHAARLLQNHWAQVLLGQSPTVLQGRHGDSDLSEQNTLRQVSGQNDAVLTDAAETPETTRTGVAERIKNWLPEPLRF